MFISAQCATDMTCWQHVNNACWKSCFWIAWLSINHNHCPECSRCPGWRHSLCPLVVVLVMADFSTFHLHLSRHWGTYFFPDRFWGSLSCSRILRHVNCKGQGSNHWPSDDWNRSTTWATALYFTVPAFDYVLWGACLWPFCCWFVMTVDLETEV